MKAKVKAGQKVSVVRSAGILFTEHEWVPVPEYAESEILANGYLVTDRVAIDDDFPAAKMEPEPTVEPQTVEDSAVKLVVTQPGSRKGKRKL